jgi:hypothetical protein
VLWVVFDEKTLAIGPFLWFGGLPGQPLPGISSFLHGKHTKGNAHGVEAVRPNIRVFKRNVFRQVASVPELVERLFRAIAVAPILSLQKTTAAVLVPAKP